MDEVAVVSEPETLHLGAVVVPVLKRSMKVK